jgi:hypothetical protein
MGNYPFILISVGNNYVSTGSKKSSNNLKNQSQNDYKQSLPKATENIYKQKKGSNSAMGYYS